MRVSPSSSQRAFSREIVRRLDIENAARRDKMCHISSFAQQSLSIFDPAAGGMVAAPPLLGMIGIPPPSFPSIQWCGPSPSSLHIFDGARTRPRPMPMNGLISAAAWMRPHIAPFITMHLTDGLAGWALRQEQEHQENPFAGAL